MTTQGRSNINQFLILHANQGNASTSNELSASLDNAAFASSPLVIGRPPSLSLIINSSSFGSSHRGDERKQLMLALPAVADSSANAKQRQQAEDGYAPVVTKT